MYRQALRTAPTITQQAARHTPTNTIVRPLFASSIRFQSTETRQTTSTGATMTASAVTRVSDRIKHDHDELQEYYNNIKNAQRDDDKVKWQNQFVWELARHSVAEEIVVYPAFEKHIPNGVVMAEKDRSEHQQVCTYIHIHHWHPPRQPNHHKPPRNPPSNTQQPPRSKKSSTNSNP